MIKKIISKVEGHERRIRIGKILSENVVSLVQSPYGNYAVQQALDVSTLELIFATELASGLLLAPFPEVGASPDAALCLEILL